MNAYYNMFHTAINNKTSVGSMELKEDAKTSLGI